MVSMVSTRDSVAKHPVVSLSLVDLLNDMRGRRTCVCYWPMYKGTSLRETAHGFIKASSDTSRDVPGMSYTLELQSVLGRKFLELQEDVLQAA